MISEYYSNLERLSLPEKYKSKLLHIETHMFYVLNYVPPGIPGYTDHGLLHTYNLIELLSYFVKNWEETTQKKYTNEEKFLMCVAAWLHDIGCILGRTNHNNHSKNSLKILCKSRHLSGFLESALDYDKRLLFCLKHIIGSHSSKYSIDNIIRVKDNHVHPEVRLDLVCATFRLIDGCDIASSRAKPIVFEILKKFGQLNQENIPFWKAHLSIMSITFNRNTIEVYIKRNKRNEAKLLVNHLNNELDELNKVFSNYGISFKIRQLLK